MRDTVPRLRRDNPLRRPAELRGDGLPRLTPRPACVLTTPWLAQVGLAGRLSSNGS